VNKPPLWERLRDWLMTQRDMMATVDEAAAAMGELPIYVRYAGADGPSWLVLEMHNGVEHICLDGD
jgi:hypothetical protein